MANSVWASPTSMVYIVYTVGYSSCCASVFFVRYDDSTDDDDDDNDDDDNGMYGPEFQCLTDVNYAAVI